MVNEIKKLIENEGMHNIDNLFNKFMEDEENIYYFLSNIDTKKLNNECKLLVNKMQTIVEVIPLREKLLELIDYNYIDFNKIIYHDEELKIRTINEMDIDFSPVELLQNIDFKNFNLTSDCFVRNENGYIISLEYNEYIEYIDNYINTMTKEQLQDAIELLFIKELYQFII